MTIDIAKWASEYRNQRPDDAIEYRDSDGNYKTDAYGFESISAVVQQRGYLRKEEFREIGLWKYSPNDYLYKRNSEEDIENWTSKAIQAGTPAEKISALRNLEGVGVPVASAILCVIFPEKYATIDFRALRALPFATPTPIFDRYEVFAEYLDAFRRYGTSTDAYKFYLDEVDKVAAASGLNAREVDMALWQYDKTNGP